MDEDLVFGLACRAFIVFPLFWNFQTFPIPSVLHLEELFVAECGQDLSNGKNIPLYVKSKYNFML